MVPREAGRGRSFKGAGQYYLRDKGALTSERVAFTHTENVPTQDPEKALKWMAWTAIHAEELKREAGSDLRGRSCTKPVFTFSLSWHPEQDPKKWEMIGAGRRALIALGLQDHETVMVAHNDCDHPHLHLIVNVVDPETGKANRVPFSKKKLSKWAEEYELAHGKVYCDKRVENNQKRDQGEKAKYEEPELDLKARITKLYQESETGVAFQTALAEQGFILAKGKRIVLIERDGNMHSLSRQLDGIKAKDMRTKLGDLDLPDVESVREQQASLKTEEAVHREAETQSNATEKSEFEYFDRDQQDCDWNERIIDAGIQADDRGETHEYSEAEDVPEGITPDDCGSEGVNSTPQRPRPGPAKKGKRGQRRLTELFASPQRPEPSPFELNKLQDRHLAELGGFYTRNTQSRLKLAATLNHQYGNDEWKLRGDVERLEDILKNSGRLRIWWLKLSNQIPKDPEQDVQEKRMTLSNIEWRKAEAQQTLEAQIERERREIEARQRTEHEQVQQTPRMEPPDEHHRAQDTVEPDEHYGPSFE